MEEKMTVNSNQLSVIRFKSTVVRSLTGRCSLFTANCKGFTLIEISAVLVISGVLAAIATPSMIGMNARQTLKADMNRVKSALQEAQRNAIKKGSSCQVSLTAPNSITSPCFSEAVSLNSKTSFVSSLTGFNQVTFSFKGNLTANGTGSGERILIFSNTQTSSQKCLAIATGIGIFRGGDYQDGVCRTSL
jgi:prepilin-type N-terminal cleavage/methylation domain-containing protein